MARPLKIFLMIVGGFFALLALVAIAVSLIFNPNDYKDDAARAAKEKTGRELEIKGDMKLTLYPWLGASISDVQLENAKGFGADPFLKVGQVNVGVKLMPLFKNRVEVAKIKVDGLTLNLEKKADGTNNWQDLGDDKFRNVFGFGFKFVIPQIGNIPVSLDFGFPLTKEDEDERQTVTFDIGKLF